MLRRLTLSLLIAVPLCGWAEEQADTLSQALSEVVVTGSREMADVRHLPATVTVVGREELTERHQSAVLATLSDLVPGLFVTARGMMGYGVSNGAAGGISVRGLAGGTGQMMVLIDGHPQYNGIYGHPVADAYQTMMAERVEVVRGPASMLYGSSAMGGVVNIVTRGGREDGVRTEVSLGAGSWGTVQGEATNTVRHKSFSSRVAVQYGRSDNHRHDMGFEQYGGHLNLGYDISSRWKIFADADITHFNASNPGSEASPLAEADQSVTRGVVTVGADNNYERMSGSVSIYANFGIHKINDGYGPAYHKNTPQTELFRSRDALAGLSVYETFRLFRGNHLTIGLDYQHIYGRAYYTSRTTGEEVTGMGASGDNRAVQSATQDMDEVAGYVDFRQDITRWLTIDAGIRLDHHTVAGSEWIPQGGIVVRPTEDGELKAMVAKGFRHPSLKEMYLFGSANDALLPERIVNYELSWRHRLVGGRLVYGANIFYLKGDNLIQTVNRKNVNTGAVENWGAEIDATYAINSHWTVSTNHSLLRMEHKVVAAPEYKGFLGVRYTAKSWFASLGLQHIAGLYTAVGDNEKKETFTLLNLTAGWHVIPSLTLWAKGDNLLAQRYEINEGYPMPRATFMCGATVKF
ncbi:MAG: TonB-dependent receptor [Bacteroidaceae bacterium]|nr:TonB-dependent receptor [Bacteroidaceae bacterium]